MTQLNTKNYSIVGIWILLLTPFIHSQEKVYELEPLYVTGDLLNSPVDRMPSSLTLIDDRNPANASSQHFEDLAGNIPNLNWAGGTSRPRFFQIRGIGENSQFGNEIPASSVGFIIDGIDFTGIGTVATLFDISRVEVLRGPQAAAFGANAMAGMILIETNAPGPESAGIAESAIGNHSLMSFGIADGGSILPGSLEYRVSINHYEDNGFRENGFLERDDTNQRNEWSSQMKLLYQWSKEFSVQLNMMYFDFNNGYDAWALDNDSFHTTTDEPGQDRQQTAALGLTAKWQLSEQTDLSYRVSATDSEMLYGYDWDWSNPSELMDLYGDEVYWGNDTTDRARDVWSHDLRIASHGNERGNGIKTNWVAGLYYRDFQEEQDYFGINSDYSTETTAIYGQARITLTQQLAMTVAGRLESVEINFSDSSGNSTSSDSQLIGDKENLWGGKVAMEYSPLENHLIYLSIDRGYKAGGVNLDDEVPVDFRVYGGENLISYELGWRGLFDSNNLILSANLFHMDRKDIQVDSSIQLGDGNTFALYKDNAASGTNYGVEMEATWQATGNLEIIASAGLLRASFDEYSYVDPADPSRIIDLGGKEQAYAPGFTYSIGASYTLSNGVFIGSVIEGKDAYYFDVLSGQLLEGYNLVRLHAGYNYKSWTATVWIKNVFDERYDVRGFYFANEPPYYDVPKKWVSQGTPRQFGVTIKTRF